LKYDLDFQKSLQGYSLTTVNIIYYMPDHSHLINEFLWQTMDIIPRYPRIHKFLNYWHKEINAVIKEVQISSNHTLKPRTFKSVDHFFSIN
jgi:uncharacterized protein Usg